MSVLGAPFDEEAVPSREAKQRPENPLSIVTPDRVFVEQALDQPGLEVTEATEALRRQLVLEHPAELMAQPSGRGTHEPALGRPQMGSREAGAQRTSQ